MGADDGKSISLKKVIDYVYRAFEVQLIESAIWKWVIWKQDLTSILDNFQSAYVCNISSRVLLVIWDLMIANNCKLILFRSFCSSPQVIHINSVTKYMDLQQGEETIWEWMRLISMPKTVLLLITYAEKVEFFWGAFLWVRVFAWANRVQSQVESYQRLKKLVLDASLLNTQH